MRVESSPTETALLAAGRADVQAQVRLVDVARRPDRPGQVQEHDDRRVPQLLHQEQGVAAAQLHGRRAERQVRLLRGELPRHDLHLPAPEVLARLQGPYGPSLPRYAKTLTFTQPVHWKFVGTKMSL